LIDNKPLFKTNKDKKRKSYKELPKTPKQYDKITEQHKLIPTITIAQHQTPKKPLKSTHTRNPLHLPKTLKQQANKIHNNNKKLMSSGINPSP